MVRPADGGHGHLHWSSAFGRSKCEGNLVARLDGRVGAHAYAVQRQVIDDPDINDRFLKPPSRLYRGKGTAEWYGGTHSVVSSGFVSCRFWLLNRLHRNPPREKHCISRGGFCELFLHFMYGLPLQHPTMMVRHGAFSRCGRSGSGNVSADSSKDAHPGEHLRP